MRKLTPWIIGVAILAQGCSGNAPTLEKPPFADRIGKGCKVQIRRGDVLGAGADIPVSVTTDSHNGAEVSVSGKLVAASANWIVIETGTSQYSIPRDSILLVEFPLK